MRIGVPPRKVREISIDLRFARLSESGRLPDRYCETRRMRIVIDGRKLGKGDIASHFENKTYSARRGLHKQTVLHNLYHHLVYVNGLEVADCTKERSTAVQENFTSKDYLNLERCFRGEYLIDLSIHRRA